MKRIDLALAVAVTAALAVTAGMLANSWGGTYWLLDAVCGAAVLALVLLRRGWAALAVALAAAVAAGVADQPQEPGPAAALALAFLGARAVARGAYLVPAGGLAVVVATWATALPDEHGFTAVTVINAAAWVLGLAAGVVARVSGTSGAGGAASPGRRAPRAGAGADAGEDRAR
ncbi:hypothetical protein ABT369_46055 [Dactylosporangium sp. NPDC000244]|uniref:hypothetical protein n=1 Tax=Dactylosporangium sp. NPDC000244 TaxID=3154365 RepID=UPI00332744A3